MIKKFLRKKELGFSTLEMLLAFGFLIVSLSAIVVLTFGAQSVSVDLRTNSEALYIAQQELEKVRALSRQDFLAVNSTTFDDGFYNGSTTITDISQCLKKAITRLTWNNEGRPQQVELSTILSDWKTPFLIGDDCSSDDFDSSDWQFPDSFGSADLGNGQGKDIDVIEINGQKIVFLATEIPSPAHEDFFVVWPPYDASHQVGIDTGGPGLNALDVVKYSVSGKIYAYVANNSDPNQFQVIDVTDYQHPTLVAERDLPGVSGSCPHTCPGGRSIYYYDNRVYIGTHYLGPAPNLHEFHIYDVSVPDAPIHLSSVKVWHNINKIIVRGDYAYLATSANDGELIVLDINPASENYLQKVGSFNAVGDEDGLSLDLIANKIYLGRDDTSGNRPNFHILDISDPTNIRELGSLYLPNTAIFDIEVRSNLAFLGTDDANQEFQVWDVSDTAHIIRRSDPHCMNLPEIIAAIDFEDNLVYVAFRSNDVLKIIESRATCSP